MMEFSCFVVLNICFAGLNEYECFWTQASISILIISAVLVKKFVLAIINKIFSPIAEMCLLAKLKYLISSTQP